MLSLKWFIQLTLVGLSFASLAHHEAFERNMEYIYEYKSEVFSGAPGASKHYTGGTFNCHYTIQFVQPTVAIVKLSKMTSTELNREIDNFDPRVNATPHEQYTRHTEQHHGTGIIDLPFMIRYNKGQVLELFTERHEPDWAVQMKKNGLDALQLAVEEMARSSNFSVMEPSEEGLCETHYNVRPARGHEKLVHKRVNLNNCVDRDIFLKNTFEGVKCVGCSGDTFEPIQETFESRVKVVMRGQRFLIKEQVSEHNFTFTPRAGQYETALVMTRHSSRLIAVNPIHQRIPLSRDLKRADNPLKVESEKNKKLKRLLTWRPERRSDRQQFQEQVATDPFHDLRIVQAEQLLGEIVHEMRSNLSMSTPYKVSMLLDNLRVCARRQLSYLWIKHIHNAPYRNVLLNVMPLVGSFDSVATLANAIKHEAIPAYEAQIMISAIVLHAEPNPKIVYLLLEMAHWRDNRNTTQLRRAVWLAAGAVWHKFEQKSREFRETTKRSIEKLREFLKDVKNPQRKWELFGMVRRFHETMKQLDSNVDGARRHVIATVRPKFHGRKSTTEDKLLALKFVGNAGMVELEQDVTRLAHDKSLPTLVRSQAVFSLRRVAKIAPDTVIRELLPVLEDRKEIYDVRIAAYKVLMDCRPPTQVWRKIGELLQTETDKQVASFIYSHLVQFAHSAHPCIFDVIKNATEALKLAHPRAYGIYSSNVLHFSHFDSTKNVGQAMDIMTVASHNSRLPKSFMVKTNMYSLGCSINPLEFGMNTDGLQSLMDRIFRPSTFAKPSSPRGKPSDPLGVKDIKNIKNMLGVAPRGTPESIGHVYIKLFGNELTFIDIDPASIADLITKGRSMEASQLLKELEAGLPVNIEKIVVLGETLLELPSQAGQPVQAKVAATGIVKIQGSIKAVVQWSGGKLAAPSRVEVHLDLKPTLHLSLHTHVGIDLIFVKTGLASLKQLSLNNIHLKSHIVVDLQEGKLFKSYDLLKQDKEILKYQDIPMAIFKREPSIIALTSPQFQRMHMNEPLEEVKQNIDTDEFGVKVSVKGQRSASVPWFNAVVIPNNPLSTFTELNVEVMPSGKTAEKLEVHMAYNVTNEDISASGGENSTAQAQKPSSWLSSWWTDDKGEPTAKHTRGKFVNLKQQDLVFPEVMARLKTHAMPMSRKIAFLTIIRTIGSPRPAQIQIEALASCSLDGVSHSVDAKLVRTPIKNERKNWQINLHANVTTEDASSIVSGTHSERMTMAIGSQTTRDDADIAHKLCTRIQNDIVNTMRSRMEPYLFSTEVHLRRLVEVLGRFEKEKKHIPNQCLVGLAHLITDLDHLENFLDTLPPGSEMMTSYLPIIKYYNKKIKEFVHKNSRPNVLSSGEISQNEATPAPSVVITAPAKVTPIMINATVAIKVTKLCKQIVDITKLFKDDSQKIFGYVFWLKPLNKALNVLVATVKWAKLPTMLPEPLVSQVDSAVGELEEIIKICDKHEPKSKKFNHLLEKVKKKTNAIKGTFSVKGHPKMSSGFIDSIRPVQNVKEQVGKLLGLMKQIQVDKNILGKSVTNQPRETHKILTQLNKVEKTVNQLHAAVNVTAPQVLRVIRSKLEEHVLAMDKSTQSLEASAPNVKAIRDKLHALRENYQQIAALCKQSSTPKRSNGMIEQSAMLPLKTSVSLCAKITYGEEEKLNELMLTIMTLNSSEENEQMKAEIDKWRSDTGITKIVRDKLANLQKLLALKAQLGPEQSGMLKWLMHLHYEIVHGNDTVRPVVDGALWLLNHFYTLTLPASPSPIRQSARHGVYDAILAVRPDGNETEVVVSSPEGHMKFTSVSQAYLPCHPLAGNPSHTIILHNLQQLYSSKFTPETCTVNGLSVKTFDGKTFTLPDTQSCQRFLAMDCSHSNQFAISVKRVHSANEYRIVLPHNVITVQSKPSQPPYVMVNGHTLHIPAGGKTVLPVPGHKDCTLRREDDSLICTAPAVGVNATIRGRHIEIQTTSYYGSKICGICGNHDGNAENDLVGPQRIRHAKVESFSKKYTFPDNCSNSEIHLRASQGSKHSPDISTTRRLPYPSIDEINNLGPAYPPIPVSSSLNAATGRPPHLKGSDWVQPWNANSKGQLEEQLQRRLIEELLARERARAGNPWSQWAVNPVSERRDEERARNRLGVGPSRQTDQEREPRGKSTIEEQNRDRTQREELTKIPYERSPINREGTQPAEQLSEQPELAHERSKPNLGGGESGEESIDLSGDKSIEKHLRDLRQRERLTEMRNRNSRKFDRDDGKRHHLKYGEGSQIVETSTERDYYMPTVRCESKGDEVRTINGSEMTLPHNVNCMRLLATNSHPKMAVMYKGFRNPHQLEFFLVLEECLVEILPYHPTLLVNNHPVVLKQGQTLKNPKNCPVVIYDKQGEITVRIQRVMVVIQGPEIMLRMPLAEKMKGLCTGEITVTNDVTKLLPETLRPVFRKYIKAQLKTCPDEHKPASSWLTSWMY